MRAKAKKTPMCSASLIARKLKGLAAPGEALKNMFTSSIFLKYLAANAANNCEKGAVNQSAASAASLDYVKFQAVIKSHLSFLEAALAADLITA